MLMAKGASAIESMEAIAGVLEALEDNEIGSAEAIEEISTLVSEYFAYEEIENMSQEDFSQLVSDAEDNVLVTPGNKRIKS